MDYWYSYWHFFYWIGYTGTFSSRHVKYELTEAFVYGTSFTSLFIDHFDLWVNGLFLPISFAPSVQHIQYPPLYSSTNRTLRILRTVRIN